MVSRVHFVLNLMATYLAAWGVVFVVSRRSVRENALRFMVSSLSLGFTVGLLELLTFFAIVDYRIAFNTPIMAPWRNPGFQTDPELIYRRKPHDHIVGTMRGGDFAFLFDAPEAEVHEYDLRYDRNGFRNPSDLESADYVLIGDSFLEADFALDNEVISTRLAALSGRTVANLGIIGYGPQQQLIVLKRYALPLQPRAIVWLFFEGNDLDNIHAYSEMMKDLDASRAFHNSIVQRSFTKNALLALSRWLGDPKPSGKPRSGLVKTASGDRRRVYFLYPGQQLGDSELAALGAMEEVLREAWGVCAAHDIQFWLAFVPTKFRVYHPLAEFEVGSDSASWTLSDLPVRLRAVVSDISPSFQFLDLTPALVEATRRGDLPYYHADSHWNPLGHDICAHVLHAALEASRN